jgi:hypothetical protein
MGNTLGGRATSAPLVFLDVDGVLNSAATRNFAHFQDDAKFDAPSEEMTRIFCNQIVHPTKAKVILSSTWRLKEHKYAEVREALAKHGVQIVGATANREMLHVDNQRPDEIGEFIETYEKETNSTVKNWVAIDDLPLDLFAQEGRPQSPGNCLTKAHFVKTSDATGLTEDLAREAVRKLNA